MRAAEALLLRIREMIALPEPVWTPVPGTVGQTVRHIETKTTPDWAKGSLGYPFETYDILTFVTLVAGKVIVGTAPAPWVGRRDWDAPFWLANAILDDPALAHDEERIYAMRRARRVAQAKT